MYETHTHTRHQSYQSFSLLLHGAQQLRELLQRLSCKISYSTNLCNTSLHVVILMACFALLLTYTDLIIRLGISDTLELELLQRLRETLNSERKT